MSSLRERIAANRAARQRKTIEVDEWGDNGVPLTIYFTEVTARDVDKIQRKHKDFLSNPTVVGMVDVIINKAEDEQGEKLFTLEDKPVLLGEPLGLIGEVFAVAFSSLSIEEQEKNSEATHSDET